MLSAAMLILFGGLITALFLHQRAQWLASIDIRVETPPVPQTVLERVRAAEATYYASQSLPRQLAEYGQDIVTFAAPALTYRFNFSVGPYHIKARTIEELLPFAVDNGFVTINNAPDHHALQAIAYFAEQPGLVTWGAALVLESLRQRHPQLRDLDWETIADDDQLIAKLYSGYMGAGGDWATWEASLAPGPEARRRLGL